MGDYRPQFWLVSLDRHGNPKLVDGSHWKRSGAEKALTLIRSLGMNKGEKFAIAEIHLSDPTGEHEPVNEEAIATLNHIGLRP